MSGHGNYAAFNLAAHVDDDPVAVATNRHALVVEAGLPAQPQWLDQVHGARALELPCAGSRPAADAAWTRRPATVCAVLTADCLPVLFCTEDGRWIAAAHAGWRGLAAGILEETVAASGASGQRLLAWLGAAIGPDAFEVGPEVRKLFVDADPLATAAFREGRGDRWFADIYALARLRLARCGVTRVYGGGLCTHSDAARFYSFRRDGRCGRMASLIWIAERTGGRTDGQAD